MGRSLYVARFGCGLVVARTIAEAPLAGCPGWDLFGGSPLEIAGAAAKAGSPSRLATVDKAGCEGQGEKKGSALSSE
jgi:hypothetical protein